MIKKKSDEDLEIIKLVFTFANEKHPMQVSPEILFFGDKLGKSSPRGAFD